MRALLLFLLLPTLTFAQKQDMTYAEANPGVLSVFIDVSSDTAHLKSLIGEFDKNEISKLKNFLNSFETLILQNHSWDSYENTATLVDSLLLKLLNRKIDPCKIIASDTSYAVFNSPLENEVIRPLILWVERYYYTCQMQTTVWGLDEAKQKLQVLTKRGKQ
jgi:hypothetical protein